MAAEAAQWKRAWAKATMVLLSLFLTLALIELLLGAIPGLLPPPVLAAVGDEQPQVRRSHGVLGTVYRPGLDLRVTSNPEFSYRLQTQDLGFTNLGFRDDGVTGEPWAVAVGDSLTAGLSVDNRHSWPELLEKHLGRDVANLGVDAYSAEQNSRMLTHVGLDLSPKLALWAFYENDHFENTIFFREDITRKRARLRVRHEWREAVDPVDPDIAAGSAWGASLWVAPLPADGALPLPIRTWKIAYPGGPEDKDRLVAKPRKNKPDEPGAVVLRGPQGLDRTGGGPLTIALRFRYDQNTGKAIPLLVQKQGPRGLLIALAPNGKVRAAFIGDAQTGVASRKPLALGEWHQVTVVLDPEQGLRMHVDDQPVVTQPGQLTGESSETAPVRLLGHQAPGVDLDQVQVFGVALSADAAGALDLAAPPVVTDTPLPRGTLLAEQGVKGWRLFIDDDGFPVLQLRSGKSQQSWQSKRPITGTGWSHVLVGVDPGDTQRVRFWVDGRGAGARPLGPWKAPLANGGPVLIGPAEGDPALTARLRQVRLHGQVPTAEDIVGMASEGADSAYAPSAREVARWTLDETVDGLVLDASGRGNVGRVEGAADCGDGGPGLCFEGGAHIVVDEPGPHEEKDWSPRPDELQERPRAFYLRELVDLVRNRGVYADIVVDEDTYLPFADGSLDLFLRKFTLGGPTFRRDHRKTPLQGEGVALSIAALERAAAACQAQGTQLVIIGLPTKEYTYWEAAGPLLDEYRDGAEPDWPWFQVAERAEELGLVVIDVRSAFREAAAAGEQLYWKQDGHVNQQGQALIAEVVRAGLEEHGLLP